MKFEADHKEHNLRGFKDFYLNKGNNLALTGLFAPTSLEGGTREESKDDRMEGEDEVRGRRKSDEQHGEARDQNRSLQEHQLPERLAFYC